MGIPLYDRVRRIIDSARAGAARSVDTAQVVSNWLVGREIFREDKGGQGRADYGQEVIKKLSFRMTARYGSGYSPLNLALMVQFFRNYGDLLAENEIFYALRKKSQGPDVRIGGGLEMQHAARAKSWRPGLFHPNLCWTHYRALLKADPQGERAFYEIEAVKNNWAARELERQMASLLYERLAKSRDKAGLMELATRGEEVRTPADVFKDPVVMEFLGLPESHRLVESDLEQALIGNLREFLLEMGKGFAFVARQERLSLDGDHFYVDLVFYHAVLKCYALVDLKVGKLTHQDLGQMQLYVNYFDRERRTEGDGPTIGLILCTDKNDAVVRYTLGDGVGNIFASRYKLHLPSEAELRAEVRREVRSLSRSEQARVTWRTSPAPVREGRRSDC